MGTYIPANPTPKRSIAETLVEAEEEHYLDCPNADFFIRLAGLLLDAIFLYLIYSAIGRVGKVFTAYIIGDSGSASLSSSTWETTFNYLISVARVSAIYVYALWTQMTFGGTPGKLLLGLRVVNAQTGKTLTVTRILLRELVGKPLGVLTLGIGLALPLMRRDRRALHDLLSGSVVKRIHGET